MEKEACGRFTKIRVAFHCLQL